MTRNVDLRSDTVTHPIPEMYEAMAQAELGDDDLGDDPTVHELEALAAERLGKEASVIVTSGTMANLVAVLTHAEPGDSILCEASSHISHEDGMEVVARVCRVPIEGHRGFMSPDAIEETIVSMNGNRVSLFCMENTHNAHGGIPLTPEQLSKMAGTAHKHGLKVHMDGARLFNAATSLGIKASELTEDVDSVMFAMSKGLSCPVGSILAGPRDYIEKARRFRKIVGGSMRQTGIVAACGIVALKHVIPRLPEDHARARRLAEAIAEMPELQVDLETVHTNMTYFETTDLPIDAAEFVSRIEEHGIFAFAPRLNRIRLVTHLHISDDDIEHAINVIRKTAKEAKA